MKSARERAPNLSRTPRGRSRLCPLIRVSTRQAPPGFGAASPVSGQQQARRSKRLPVVLTREGRPWTPDRRKVAHGHVRCGPAPAGVSPPTGAGRRHRQRADGRSFRARQIQRDLPEGHATAMGAVRSSAKNLRAAIAGEEMYPPMPRQAESSGKAKRMFGRASTPKRCTPFCYALALEAIARGEALAGATFLLCPICRHIELGRPPENCPTDAQFLIL
jgi:hypothetical protein